MSYSLGLDLGTTFTVAAVARDGRTEVVGLGNHAAAIPTAVLLREDGELLVGDAAVRRGQQEPARLAKEFKRRLGDQAPIILGHTPYSAERLMAVVIRAVVDQVRERQGDRPSAIAIAHPANWGPFKRELLAQAASLAGLDGVTFVSEPEAAAVHFASGERVDEGGIVAIYDLGGGTFDAAVLRRTADGFTTLGQPQGIERLGGIDFDEAVMSHIRATLGAAVSTLDVSDPAVRSGLVRLRADCIAAKEALSDDSETTIPVLLPALQTQVRLTRLEFEEMIRPPLRETITMLGRALESAGVQPAELTAVVLAGGSSRIPLVAEMVGGAIGRPVAVDAHPKHTVALGAARVAEATRQPAPLTITPVDAPDPVPSGATPVTGAGPADPVGPVGPVTPAAMAAAPPRHQPQPTPETQRKKGHGLAIALAVIGLLIGGGLVAYGLQQRGDGADAETESTDVEDTRATPDTATATEPSTEDSPATTADGSEEPPTCLSPTGSCVRIDEATLDGETVVVRYSLTYDPDIDGGPGSKHVHFFFDNVPVTEAGIPASSGNWVVYDTDEDGDLEYRFPAADIPAEATQLCAAAANDNHSLDNLDARCVELP